MIFHFNKYYVCVFVLMTYECYRIQKEREKKNQCKFNNMSQWHYVINDVLVTLLNRTITSFLILVQFYQNDVIFFFVDI